MNRILKASILFAGTLTLPSLTYGGTADDAKADDVLRFKGRE